MHRVLVFGTFDLLHPGHLYFLREAKKYGDHLTVIVAQDKRVRREKGSLPRFAARDRVRMLRALALVNTARIGERAGEWTLIARLKPDAVCVGYDQTFDRRRLASQFQKLKKTPKIIRIKPFHPREYKSSKF